MLQILDLKCWVLGLSEGLESSCWAHKGWVLQPNPVMFSAAKPGWLSDQPGECHTGSPVWSRVWNVPHVCISVCACLPWISQDLQSLLWWLWKDHRGCEPTRTQVKTPGGWRRRDRHSPPNSAWVFLANSHSSWNKLRMFLTGGKHLGHYPESMPPFP